ncbi:hypothetical protein LJC15_00210 [Desulfovibrio sp. OttesenSCG-928-G11]|nr:hypothetical protein [Desulfovibrio sp. OttesenSCG-928-G11]
MRAHKLLLDLKDFLSPLLAEFPLPSPDPAAEQGLGQAKIFFGNVPDSPAEEMPERFPFVILRWMEGEDNEDSSATSHEEQAALILGVFAPQGPEQAELVTAALLDFLREKLLERRLLPESAPMFDLVLPLACAKPEPEKRQHNYHIATILTRWNHVSARRPLPQGEDDD